MPTKRDELADEYFNSESSPGDDSRDSFIAGWDAAIQHEGQCESLLLSEQARIARLEGLIIRLGNKLGIEGNAIEYIEEKALTEKDSE